MGMMDDLQKRLWAKAASHENGDSLAEGADLAASPRDKDMVRRLASAPQTPQGRARVRLLKMITEVVATEVVKLRHEVTASKRPASSPSEGQKPCMHLPCSPDQALLRLRDCHGSCGCCGWLLQW